MAAHPPNHVCVIDALFWALFTVLVFDALDAFPVQSKNYSAKSFEKNKCIRYIYIINKCTDDNYLFNAPRRKPKIISMNKVFTDVLTAKTPVEFLPPGGLCLLPLRCFRRQVAERIVSRMAADFNSFNCDTPVAVGRRFMRSL